MIIFWSTCVLPLEDKKKFIAENFQNALLNECINYSVNVKNSIQFMFCSNKLILNSQKNTVEIFKKLLYQYKVERLDPYFKDQNFVKDPTLDSMYRSLNPNARGYNFNDCELVVNDAFITSSNLLIILHLATLVNKIVFNNWKI